MEIFLPSLIASLINMCIVSHKIAQIASLKSGDIMEEKTLINQGVTAGPAPKKPL